MSRSIVLSNGELCVALDDKAAVRDIYYPHVGLEDHVRGHYVHRVGIWVDGEMSWLSHDRNWQIRVGCEEEALISRIHALHPRLQVSLEFADAVCHDHAIFLRHITIRNDGARGREIKLYVGHQFEIYKSHGGDTAYYDPESHSIVHYKGRRVFLIGGTIDGAPFQDYATGLANFAGHEGTHKDAEDGQLSKNPIEHGPADSTVGFYEQYAPQQSRTVEYWIVAAESIPDACELDSYLKKETPENLLMTTAAYWKTWLDSRSHGFHGLQPAHIALFKKSLMYVRAHVDRGGGIIASLDSDMLQYGLDTYSYVWPRDAAYAAMALGQVGDTETASRFFDFCKETISKDGYFMHKYLPDRSLGSSWHPWIRNGHSELPIQEDETALVLCALHNHYTHSHDVEMIESLYTSLIEKAADFLVSYRDPTTGLPLSSYDVWEEKRGSSTFTASVVYGALSAAAELSNIINKKNNEERYRSAAEEVRDGILANLWDEKEGYFIKHIDREGETITKDKTLDISSAYGIYAFEILPPDDERLIRAFEISVRRLSLGISVGGLARYEGDNYYRRDRESAGNPWIMTTLWYARYLIARAKSDADLEKVRDIFTWTAKHAQPSGVLSEQLDPHTGAQISAAPLTWSHAAYVHAVLRYLEKLKSLGITTS
ncbi:glycoside hydrolase family 15 protein [Candidatus Kaiserbacteria bacterium]|nr:glycoside hydrolase family 15 protein [Candidatus Kaiserbacteria bacterium]